MTLTFHVLNSGDLEEDQIYFLFSNRDAFLHITYMCQTKSRCYHEVSSYGDHMYLDGINDNPE